MFVSLTDGPGIIKCPTVDSYTKKRPIAFQVLAVRSTGTRRQGQIPEGTRQERLAGLSGASSARRFAGVVAERVGASDKAVGVCPLWWAWWSNKSRQWGLVLGGTFRSGLAPAHSFGMGP